MVILQVMSMPINIKKFYDIKRAVLYCGATTDKWENGTLYVPKLLNNGRYEWRIAEFNVIQMGVMKPASKALSLDDNVFLYIGETDGEFQKDCFYRCVVVEKNGLTNYKWQQVNILENDNQYMSMSELNQYWGIS